jgi:hypothetical protein
MPGEFTANEAVRLPTRDFDNNLTRRCCLSPANHVSFATEYAMLRHLSRSRAYVAQGEWVAN